MSRKVGMTMLPVTCADTEEIDEVQDGKKSAYRSQAQIPNKRCKNSNIS